MLSFGIDTIFCVSYNCIHYSFINLPLLPLGYIFGTLGAGAPNGNIFDFLMGFVFLQAVPIILLIVSIIYTVVVHKRKKQQA